MYDHLSRQSAMQGSVPLVQSTRTSNKDSVLLRLSNDLKNANQTWIKVPLRVLFAWLVASSSISYLAGRVGRRKWMRNTTDRLHDGLVSSSVRSKNDDDVCNASLFPSSAIVENTSRFVVDKTSWKQLSSGGQEPEGGETEDDDDDTELLPVGDHLVVDFQGVDRAFLVSRELLLEATVELASDLDAFDIGHYFCHDSSQGGGMVCGGTSRGNDHIWIHTRPIDGVLFVDVFAAGIGNEMVSLVPSVERLFGRPEEMHSKQVSKPLMRWLHKVRGFHDMLDEADTYSMADLQWYPVGMIVDYKKEVASVQTKFQHISVWDVLSPTRGSIEAFEQSLSMDDSYPSIHPELFAPDRIVFLDGLLQSRSTGDAAYHEALVHPALFAHPNPRRVAIIGGGEGATLREVLKHRTIEEVVMIEIDAMMVNTSRTYLPEWNDCSNIQGRADNCFDDRKTTLYCEDAFQWFKDRFVQTVPGEPEEMFDVIIMDALDPQGLQDIVAALYTDSDFYEALYNGLAPDGILIAQVGESADSIDPYTAWSADRHTKEFVDGLKKLGFSAITEYEEAGCGFYSAWAFIVASKGMETISEAWLANEALIDLRIRQRILPTVNGGSSLLFFDGATMAAYRYPTRLMEDVYCRNPSLPHSCKPEIREFRPPELGPGESTADLGRFMHYIHVEGSAQRILSKSLELCGHGRCAKEVLSSYKDEFGGKDISRNVSAITFLDFLGLPTSWALDATRIHDSVKLTISPRDFQLPMFAHDQGHRIATHHLSTKMTSKLSCGDSNTSSIDDISKDNSVVGSDIDDIVRLRQTFICPTASRKG